MRPIDAERIQRGDPLATVDAVVAILDALNDLALKVDALIPRWVDVTYDATDFTTNDGTTWTVSSADAVAFAYTLSGHTLAIRFVLNDTSLSAGTAVSLKIRLPRGLKAAGATTSAALYLIDNGAAAVVGAMSVTAGGTDLLLQKIAGAAWAAAANTTSVHGEVILQILPPSGS